LRQMASSLRPGSGSGMALPISSRAGRASPTARAAHALGALPEAHEPWGVASTGLATAAVAHESRGHLAPAPTSSRLSQASPAQRSHAQGTGGQAHPSRGTVAAIAVAAAAEARLVGCAPIGHVAAAPNLHSASSPTRQSHTQSALPRQVQPSCAAAAAAAMGVAPKPKLERAPSARRAMECHVDAGHPVVVFLTELGLQRHASTFLQSGVDDVETLLALEEDDLKDLGLPIWHRHRLCKKLSELRTELTVNHEVATFLQGAGLGEYAGPLIRHGFDDMDTLLCIEDCDLKALGMPRGHVLKFRRGLREHAAEQEAAGRDHQIPAQVAAATPPRQSTDPILAASARSAPSGEMKNVVQKSWERMEALGPLIVGDMLYKHVLALAPEAAALYPYEVRAKYMDWSSVDDESDIYNSNAMRRLFARITNAVGSCVAGLANPGQMVPRLLELGGRHLHFGAPESAWEVVREALQLTLQDALGPSYTADVQAAWQRMYDFISNLMIEGLRRAHRAQAEAEVATANARGSSCESTTEPTTPSGTSQTVEAAEQGKSCATTPETQVGMSVAAVAGA